MLRRFARPWMALLPRSSGLPRRSSSGWVVTLRVRVNFLWPTILNSRNFTRDECVTRTEEVHSQTEHTMSTVQEQATQTGITTWQIDPNHSLVEFSAKHMMITTVKGRFSKVSGTIVVDEQNPDGSRVETEIEAASIDTRAEQRDQHLRSADFLDVEKHPNISFRSRRVLGTSKNPGDEFKVIGDLTIRGTTREVTLDSTYEGTGKDHWGGERV